jgi:hypothetical protein
VSARRGDLKGAFVGFLSLDAVRVRTGRDIRHFAGSGHSQLLISFEVREQGAQVGGGNH